MEPLTIEETPKTPAVKFDKNQGLIEITGRSNPENSSEFYYPLLDWIEEYAQDPGDKTIVNIQFEYFNTRSSKCLLDFFRKLETIYSSKHEVEINWHYKEDDEDMMEAGEDYKFLLVIPFNLIEN